MSNYIKYAVILIFISNVFFFFSCSDNLINNPQDIVFPDSNVSFQNHVQPVITYNCSSQGCHNDISPAGGLRLTDYNSYFDSGVALGLVIPQNPEGSRLVQIIDNPVFHNPYIVWNFNSNHKRGIRQWISEGAINN